jgi:hypothetical protein
MANLALSRQEPMKFRATVLLAIWLFLFASQSSAATIDFDGTGAPNAFINTTALRNAFAASGVNFAGPGGNDGGAILNEGGNFGIGARSGTDFLAFNRLATMSDSGIPRDPETVIFDSPVSSVGIWAAGGLVTGLFQLEAFDVADVFLGIAQIPAAGEWQLLSLTAPNIKKVRLTELNGLTHFVYDDLNFESEAVDQIPEPGTLGLLLAGLLVMLVSFRQACVSQQVPRNRSGSTNVSRK